MYPVSNDFHTIAIQDAPTTRIRIYFIPDTVDCTDDNDVQTNGTLLVNSVGDTDSNGRIADSGVVFNEFFNPDKNITLGSCVSSQIEMTLLNYDGALNGYTFGRCKVYLDVYDAANSTWLPCPMGVYLLEQPVKTRQKLINVTGYDQMRLLDTDARAWWDSYVKSVKSPVDLAYLVYDMANHIGVSLSTREYADMLNTDAIGNSGRLWIFRMPIQDATLTYRKILEMICEASGTIARFDRDGALDLRWFDDAETSEQETYTGSLISIADGTGGTVSSLTIPITPTQNLNGYSKPWAAGAGKNKLNNVLTTTTRGTVTFATQPDGSVLAVSSTPPTTSVGAGLIPRGFSLPEGTYILSGCPAGGGNVSYDMRIQLTTNGESQTKYDYGSGVTFTVESGTVIDFIRIAIRTNYDASAGVTFWPMIRLASVADDSYEPYANICPFTGLTGLSVYVSPTQDVADATTYAEDWTLQAGTVYAGSIEAVSGSLKARPRYASYNGETLVGPWMSSMDEYAAGATPTTGAEVVDLGGTETAYQLTAVSIPLLSGQNYLWSSNGGAILLAASFLRKITINTDALGNQCLSIDVSEYAVERYGNLDYKLGSLSISVSHTPTANNTYYINGNVFLNNRCDPYIDPQPPANWQYKNILDRLYALGSYTPIHAKFIWDWSVEAGDIIDIIHNSQTYAFPIFQSKLTWRGGFVIAETANDGDATMPIEKYVEEVHQIVYPFSIPGNSGTAVDDIPFSAGENALIVLSATGSNGKSISIAHCEMNGTMSNKVISSATGISYSTTYNYFLEIANSTNETVYGLKIRF